MIHIAISLVVALLLTFGFTAVLEVHPLLSTPIGLIAGLIVFFVLGRKVQGELEKLMTLMQRELQAGKIDRAIEILKRGYKYQWRHIFIKSQLNSQIGMMYYIKKDYDTALSYLKGGFVRNFVSQGMLGAAYYRRKEPELMKKALEANIQANRKESFAYALFAYLLDKLGERDKAIGILQKGLAKLPDDERLQSNLAQLQNNKKMKMKPYGDIWIQFMLERPPRMQQTGPPHMRMSKKAMFR